MEPELRALAEAPSVWARGGNWKIEWREVAEAESEINVDLEGEWICVTTDGPHGGVRVDDVDLDTFELKSKGIRYSPVLEEPDMYLTFASLGRSAWKCLDDQYLGGYVKFEKPGPDYLTEDVKQKVLSFHERYGPPYMWWHRGVHQTILTDMLHEAQLIDVVVQYQRVVAREADISRLRKMMTAIVESERKSIRAQNRMRDRTVSKLKSMDMPTEMLKKVRSEKYRSRYGSLNLSEDADLLRSVEIMIREVQGREWALGALEIHVENTASLDSDEDVGWRFTFAHQHLTNIIWYQAFQALIRRSLIRTCRNDQCPKPDGLFPADRPNQFYCSVTCRNYHNTVTHRNKISRKSIDDLLPGAGKGGPK